MLLKWRNVKEFRYTRNIWYTCQAQWDYTLNSKLWAHKLWAFQKYPQFIPINKKLISSQIPIYHMGLQVLDVSLLIHAEQYRHLFQFIVCFQTLQTKPKKSVFQFAFVWTIYVCFTSISEVYDCRFQNRMKYHSK